MINDDNGEGVSFLDFVDVLPIDGIDNDELFIEENNLLVSNDHVLSPPRFVLENGEIKLEMDRA